MYSFSGPTTTYQMSSDGSNTTHIGVLLSIVPLSSSSTTDTQLDNHPLNQRNIASPETSSTFEFQQFTLH